MFAVLAALLLMLVAVLPVYLACLSSKPQPELQRFTLSGFVYTLDTDELLDLRELGVNLSVISRSGLKSLLETLDDLDVIPGGITVQMARLDRATGQWVNTRALDLLELI